MKTLRLLFVLGLFAFVSSTAIAAEEYGSAEEAKEMLERAIAALKADKAEAIEMFNERADGFGDRDLYVYCGGADGNFTAHYNEDLRGKSLKNLKDKAGNAFGEEIYSVAEEGEIETVEYQWTRPGEETPTEKVAYVSKVDDQICGVGYYK